MSIDRRSTDSVLEQRIAAGQKELTRRRAELVEARAKLDKATQRVMEQTSNVLAMIEGRRYV